MIFVYPPLVYTTSIQQSRDYEASWKNLINKQIKRSKQELNRLSRCQCNENEGCIYPNEEIFWFNDAYLKLRGTQKKKLWRTLEGQWIFRSKWIGGSLFLKGWFKLQI
jgi:hypothetical protein